MPEIEVSAQQVAELGEELGEVSAFLAAVGRVSSLEAWAFGPGTAASAMQDLLGNWERYRILLGRELDALAAGAKAAGAAYLRVEAEVSASLGGR